MFKPKCIYYEKNIVNYELGKELLSQYSDIPKIIIENHNNIEELRKKENKEFGKMKQNLIIGTRKTHKFVENHKISDYLVPVSYTHLDVYKRQIKKVLNNKEIIKNKITA